MRETLQGTVLCQVQMPDMFEMASPWDPVLAVGAQGQLLYVKGNFHLLLQESNMFFHAFTFARSSGNS